MKNFLLAAIATGIGFNSYGQSPTWADNVATIIYDNCSSCHHEGGIGPFTLVSYQDAVDNAYNIQAQVTSKLMPPWKPDPDYVHFKDERILSESDINTIDSWINDGAPSGDLSQAPAPPTFQNGSQLPTIDMTLQTPSYTIPGIIDDYRTFVIHSNFTQDVFLNQIEYLPGNGAVVHHMVIFYDPTSFSWDMDQDDSLPGYESYGVGPINDDADIIGAWAPGSGIFTLPSNMGIRIPAGADFGVEVHYAPGSMGAIDSSAVNLLFTTGPQQDIREIYVDGILNHFDNLTDGPLFIPANTIKTFHEEFDWEYGDMSVFSLFPHMHLVGKSFKVWSLDANNDTTRLIDIPQWAFHWQGFYNYQKPVHITDGSQLWGEATYDNTTNNPDNPNNPPQDVESGEHTTDEMMIAFFTWTPYQPGDENIILDSTLISGAPVPSAITESVYVFPNPVSDQLSVQLDVSQSQSVQLDLLDATGAVVRRWNKPASSGDNQLMIPVANISAGIYFLKVTTNAGSQFAKVVKE